MDHLRLTALLCACLGTHVVTVGSACGQSHSEANYDEDKVPEYVLPDPLTLNNGTKVRDAKTWHDKRRPEIVRLFQEQVYGKAPGRPEDMNFKITSVKKDARGGKVTRKEITIYFTGSLEGPRMGLLLYIPNNIKKPVPAFLGLNFFGNHSITDEPDVTLSRRWMRQKKEFGIKNNQATEASRGCRASRWAIDEIVSRGYALATVYYGDIDPDIHDGFQNGVHPLSYKQGQTKPLEDEWGSIAAWSWGLSRVLDYLETDPDVDAKRVAVVGHSRLGKTALWAGASDERFGLVISNNSGCGGAALSRRRFGETVKRINTNFPHWFCDNFKKYSDAEDTLPVDQHMLLALIAPRPLYVASAVKDRWCDPRGEFLSVRHADTVYRLLGTTGMPVDELPEVDSPVSGKIGYHIRSGSHNITRYDWQQYLDFADRHLKSGL